MAQKDWKLYYGVVLDYGTIGRTFVNGPMYGDREAAHEAAATLRRKTPSMGVFAVIGARGKTPEAQRQLHARTLRPMP
jgi:hypothetical protein